MSETTEDNVIRFLKRMKREAALLRITWFGGEPLLALKRMKSFCEKVREEIGITFESNLITNGYLLTTDKIATLKDLAATSCQITLDGLAATHNARRPLYNGKPTFDTVVNNIEALVEADQEDWCGSSCKCRSREF